MPKGNATVQAYRAKVVDGELKMHFEGLKPFGKTATNDQQIAAAVLHVAEGSEVLVAANKLGAFKTQYERMVRDR